MLIFFIGKYIQKSFFWHQIRNLVFVHHYSLTININFIVFNFVYFNLSNWAWMTGLNWPNNRTCSSWPFVHIIFTLLEDVFECRDNFHWWTAYFLSRVLIILDPFGVFKSFNACDARFFLLQVYLGEQYVNNATLSDVTFLVEGRWFFIYIVFLNLFAWRAIHLECSVVVAAVDICR